MSHQPSQQQQQQQSPISVPALKVEDNTNHPQAAHYPSNNNGPIPSDHHHNYVQSLPQQQQQQQSPPQSQQQQQQLNYYPAQQQQQQELSPSSIQQQQQQQQQSLSSSSASPPNVDDSNSDDGGNGDGSSSSASRKRKAISRKACENCRKAHACCSDVRPCKRCSMLGLSCFDIPSKKRGRKRKFVQQNHVIHPNEGLSCIKQQQPQPQQQQPHPQHQQYQPYTANIKTEVPPMSSTTITPTSSTANVAYHQQNFGANLSNNGMHDHRSASIVPSTHPSVHPPHQHQQHQQPQQQPPQQSSYYPPNSSNYHGNNSSNTGSGSGSGHSQQPYHHHHHQYQFTREVPQTGILGYYSVPLKQSSSSSIHANVNNNSNMSLPPPPPLSSQHNDHRYAAHSNSSNSSTPSTYSDHSQPHSHSQQQSSSSWNNNDHHTSRPPQSHDYSQQQQHPHHTHHNYNLQHQQQQQYPINSGSNHPNDTSNANNDDNKRRNNNFDEALKSSVLMRWMSRSRNPPTHLDGRVFWTLFDRLCPKRYEPVLQQYDTQNSMQYDPVWVKRGLALRCQAFVREKLIDFKHSGQCACGGIPTRTMNDSHAPHGHSSGSSGMHDRTNSSGSGYDSGGQQSRFVLPPASSLLSSSASLTSSSSYYPHSQAMTSRGDPTMSTTTTSTSKIPPTNQAATDEQYVQSILDSTDIGLIVYSILDARVLFWNKALRDMFGYHKADFRVKVKRWMDLMHPMYIPLTDPQLEKRVFDVRCSPEAQTIEILAHLAFENIETGAIAECLSVSSGFVGRGYAVMEITYRDHLRDNQHSHHHSHQPPHHHVVSQHQQQPSSHHSQFDQRLPPVVESYQSRVTISPADTTSSDGTPSPRLPSFGQGLRGPLPPASANAGPTNRGSQPQHQHTYDYKPI